jgi:hypothetical protein
MNEEETIDKTTIETSSSGLNKDQILAYFQEITNLDDIEQCQAILESVDWNLDSAIQAFYSGEPLITRNNEEEIEEIIKLPRAAGEEVKEPYNFTSIDKEPLQITGFKRLIKFNIEYLNDKFTLHVPENEKVSKLKQLIQEEIKVPKNYQRLHGWKQKDRFISDNTCLRDLYLPIENNLYVVNMMDDFDTNKTALLSNMEKEAQDKKHFRTFQLLIRILPQCVVPNSDMGHFFRLNFDSTVKFIEVRRKLAMLTNIFVDNQNWWYYSDPSERELEVIKTAVELVDNKRFQTPVENLFDDNSSLSEIKDSLDILDTNINSKSTSSDPNRMVFIVKLKNESYATKTSSVTESSTATTSSRVEENLFDIENDDDILIHNDDEDLNFSIEADTHKQRKALITEDCLSSDELVCTNTFNENFIERYGPLIPLFYIGSLEDAIKEALTCQAKDRKLLGIYLHSDHTVFCNIFCTKNMCDENVINFLSTNFVVWPWDITVKEHENHFYETCSKHLGSVFVSNLKSMKEKFPLLLIVTRARGNNEVSAIIEGDCTNEQVLDRLMQAYEMFEAQRHKDEQDERIRDERERIKREQDAAYQMSLELDKAKRQRQTEEYEKQKREAEMEQKHEKQRLEVFEKRRSDARARLPTEPSEDEKITRIRFRMPSGEVLLRKFRTTEKLEVIIDYMTSLGYFVENHKLLTSWPRKDLYSESYEKSLEELKLCPQETLTLEER